MTQKSKINGLVLAVVVKMQNQDKKEETADSIFQIQIIRKNLSFSTKMRKKYHRITLNKGSSIYNEIFIYNFTLF